MITVLAFLKAHWRPIAVVVALVLAYGAGRYATPPEVITKTEVVTQVVEKVVEHVVEKRVEVAAKARVITRTVTVQGEVHEVIVEREVSKTEAEKIADKTLDKTTDTATKAETITRNDAPRLSVLLLVGADLKPAWQPIPGAGPLALGVAVNYRIAGPLTVGAWGIHTGAFGVAVGAQF